MVNGSILFLGLLLLFSIGGLSLAIQVVFLVLLFLLSALISMNIFVFLRKIKFFIATIALVFLFSVPGEVLYFYGPLSITKEGLVLAGFNIVRLVNIFTIVFILMKVLPRDFITTSIIKACLFVTYFGVKKERLIARVFLTFEYLDFYRNAKFTFNSLGADIAKQINSDYSGKIKPNLPLVTFGTKDFFWSGSFAVAFLTIQFLLI
ncbi:MAG: hypothetical protein K0U03_05100 [Betaproteobacteria bacterium]|nr:hypothetical protein [Betaproteobacteria bacterium]